MPALAFSGGGITGSGFRGADLQGADLQGAARARRRDPVVPAAGRLVAPATRAQRQYAGFP